MISAIGSDVATWHSPPRAYEMHGRTPSEPHVVDSERGPLLTGERRRAAPTPRLLADRFAGRGQREPVHHTRSRIDRARDRALAHRERLEADALRVDRRLVEAVDVRDEVVHLQP